MRKAFVKRLPSRTPVCNGHAYCKQTAASKHQVLEERGRRSRKKGYHGTSPRPLNCSRREETTKMYYCPRSPQDMVRDDTRMIQYDVGVVVTAVQCLRSTGTVRDIFHWGKRQSNLSLGQQQTKQNQLDDCQAIFGKMSVLLLLLLLLKNLTYFKPCPVRPPVFGRHNAPTCKILCFVTKNP